MVHISNPVGRGAASAKHDVAVIQAAFKNIKIKNRPIWQGRIDGRKNNVLEAAIVVFQVACNIKPTGKVEPNGPTIRALNSALPRALVNMRGVKGTCAVFVSPVGAREADRAARVAKSNAPFPSKESAGLATIITNVGRQFGICLERKREFVTRDGRFAVEMDFMKVQWIDNGSGRLLPAGRESSGATQAVCRLIQSSQEWAVGSTNDLVFESKRQVNALKSIGKATTADLKSLGLTQMPKNEVLQAIVAACARLLLSRDIRTTRGRQDHALLLEAAKGVNQQLVNKLEAAVRPGQFQMEDVALFIHGEMIRNAQGSTAAKLRAINTAADQALADGLVFVDPLRMGGTQAGFIDLKLSAYGLWISKVFKDREWDHKRRIKSEFGNVENHPDLGSGRTFFFDIWSNIHYGYVGKSVGFSRLELVSGAGAAQALDNENLPAGAMDRFKAALKAGDIAALGELDEITDRAAAELGIELWDNFGAGLSFQSFLDALRAAADRLKTGRLR